MKPNTTKHAPASGTFQLDALYPRDVEARLTRLWRMSRAERVQAMRAGELTLRELAAWSARYPHEVPTLGGEFEWIAVTTPEWADAAEARQRKSSPNAHGADR